jgi:ABC-type multidrug transport system fused ATPase/permease subunit
MFMENVSSRFSTLRHAWLRRINVADEGSVIDTDTQAKPVRRGGLYTRLAALQPGMAV